MVGVSWLLPTVSINSFHVHARPFISIDPKRRIKQLSVAGPRPRG
jgi:hypothetical protein